MVELGVQTISFGPPFHTRVDGCGRIIPRPPEPRFPGISPTAFDPSAQLQCYTEVLQKEKNCLQANREVADRMESVRHEPHNAGLSSHLGDLLPGYQALMDYYGRLGYEAHPISGKPVLPAPPEPPFPRLPRPTDAGGAQLSPAPGPRSALSAAAVAVTRRSASASALSAAAPSFVSAVAPSFASAAAPSLGSAARPLASLLSATAPSLPAAAAPPAALPAALARSASEPLRRPGGAPRAYRPPRLLGEPRGPALAPLAFRGGGKAGMLRPAEPRGGGGALAPPRLRQLPGAPREGA